MTYFHSNDVYMNMFYNISLSSIQISGSDDTIDDDLFDVLVYTFNIRFEYFNMKEKCYTCRITLGEHTLTGIDNPHKMRLLYFDDVGFKASTESNKYLNLHFDEQGCMIANQTNTKIIYIDEQNVLLHHDQVIIVAHLFLKLRNVLEVLSRHGAQTREKWIGRSPLLTVLAADP